MHRICVWLTMLVTPATVFPWFGMWYSITVGLKRNCPQKLSLIADFPNRESLACNLPSCSWRSFCFAINTHLQSILPQEFVAWPWHIVLICAGPDFSQWTIAWRFACDSAFLTELGSTSRCIPAWSLFAIQDKCSSKKATADPVHN